MSEELFEECLKEEQLLQFDQFTRDDAFRLGSMLYENSKKQPKNIAIEITVNGLNVFRFMPEGTGADNSVWLGRKRNMVNAKEMSSLRALAAMQMNNKTMVDWCMNPSEFAASGGGFPIVLKGTGMIGTICVSGLPHVEDHKLIVATLKSFLGK